MDQGPKLLVEQPRIHRAVKTQNLHAKSPSTKCLKLPATSRTVVVAAVAATVVVVDTEARGLKAPNNGRITTIHHL